MSKHVSADQKPERRLLLLAPQPFYQDRGTPIAIKYVIEALTAIGYQVDLLTFAIGNDVQFDKLTIYRTIKIPGLDSVPIGFSFKKIAYDFLLFLLMWKHLRAKDYDYIYAVEEAAFFALVAKKMTGIPVIYDMQSYMSEQLMAKFGLFREKWLKQILLNIENTLIRGVDTIICSAGLKNVVKIIKPDANVFEWFFPGLDVSISEQETVQLQKVLGISAQETVIIYTGNAESYQGIERLLESAPLVINKYPRTLFLLVGVEQQEIPSTISDDVNHLIDQEKIKCLGKQPHQRIATYLSLADVAVSPRKEGVNLPLKVFDYMRQGIPMVVTRTVAHCQILNDETAEIVGQSADEIATGIIHLLSNQRHATSLASQSKEYAEKMLSRKAFVSRINDILASTL